MPRPVNKDELVNRSDENYQKLLAYIDGLPEAAKSAPFPPGFLNRNIRDVLAHLHHWHLMFLEWYRQGMSGQQPEMPAPGYTWKDLPALNLSIRDSYDSISLPDIRMKFSSSHNEVARLIDVHTDTELFEKRRFKWTGTTSLGVYLVSATSSHYDWALKTIKKALRIATA